MKRIKSFFLLLALLLSLTGCGGSGMGVELQDRAAVPEDGTVSARTLEQIRDDNAIAVFEGTSSGIAYEWTVFGSDIADAEDTDLRVDVNVSGAAVEVSFAEDTFSFPALLSVHLPEKWQADTARAWRDGEEVCSVSLTGTEATILNLTVEGAPGSLTILPDTAAADEPPVSVPAEEAGAPDVSAEEETSPDIAVEEEGAADTPTEEEAVEEAPVAEESVEEEAPASAPDPEVSQKEAETPEKEQAAPQNTQAASGYLSGVKEADRTVYENTEEKQEETAQAPNPYLSAVKDTQSKPVQQSSEKKPDADASQKSEQKEEPKQEEKAEEKTEPNAYLSGVKDTTGRVYSDGKGSGQDQYLTDPVPAGKPMPVEPENQEVNSAKTYTCTFSIECSTILNNLEQLEPGKLEMVPSGGVILRRQTVTFYEGESVFDVLQRVCRENGIHMESSWTPIYNSAYIEGIHNLYEFDCGALSGWMYRVNGWYPNYGCSRYQLADGDVVEWRYTCDLGNDVGRSGTW